MIQPLPKIIIQFANGTEEVYEIQPDPELVFVSNGNEFTGIELPSGVVLTFQPSRECECRDCREFFEWDE